MSEADAGEDEGDQIALPYGSRPALASERSPRIDWSVLLWQRIELLPGLALLLGPNPSPAVTSAARAICAQYLG